MNTIVNNDLDRAINYAKLSQPQPTKAENTQKETSSSAETPARADSFQLSDSDNSRCAIGIYSADGKFVSAQKDIATYATAAVQNAPRAASSDYYYDVIKQKAADKAGVYISPTTGNPVINEPQASLIYTNEIRRINAAFWCQTGGWSNLRGDGREDCCRTAAATMASINSGYTVTPDDTTGNSNGLTGITVNNKNVPYNSDAGTYNKNRGPAKNLNCYHCEDYDATISAINNELANGRSVLVKTTVSGEHWVTVTGTVNGKSAKDFSDFVGIDPWYNGSNPNNNSTGTGSGACRSDLSGVFQLSIVSNQKLHSGYNIITYVP